MESVSFDAGAAPRRTGRPIPFCVSRVPDISVDVLDRPDTPSLGAGEAATGPTPAAIANAIAVAAGIRARSIPFTPETLREAAGITATGVGCAARGDPLRLSRHLLGEQLWHSRL